MKRILIAVALMFAVPAQAQSINEETCVLMGDYAGAVMNVRQTGQTKQQVLRFITTTNTQAYQLMISVLELVYSLPLSTPSTVVDDLTTNKCLETLYESRNPAGV